MEKLFGIPMDGLATFLLFAVGLILLVLAGLGWRNRVILRLGLRNIPRRRAQTLLIVFGLMLSTLIISAAFGTGDTMTHSFRALILDDLGEVDEEVHAEGERSFFMEATQPVYFDVAHFESLVDRISQRQAENEPKAELVEALTPIIRLRAPVINLTGRQSESRVRVVGHDPPTADAFDELFTLDGQRVAIADLGPDEVYLNRIVANRLAAQAGHELEIYLSEQPVRVTVKAVVEIGGLPGQVIMPLERVQAIVARPDQISAILVSNVGGPYAGAQHSSAVAGMLKNLVEETDLRVEKVKQTSLTEVEFVGSAFTTIFIGFGSFSIAAGLLLIFLIFIMLAAERKQEMGMARAVGTRRRHLIQMFVFEGTVYDLVAAAVGALLGIGVGLATVGFLARAFENIEDIGGFALRHHIEPRSVVVAYCLGVLLTFVTVSVSSWRVSRLNIVAAIRDLPPPPGSDDGLRALFIQPWRYLGDAVRQLFRLRLHRTLKRLVWDGPVATLSFLWALIERGLLTALLGILSVMASLGTRSAFLFNMGVSLVLIGVGLIARWVLRARLRRIRPETRDRLTFSFNGISLLVFWSLPFDALDFMDLPDLSAGPEMFVLSGIMMVAGAVWTIIYNSDLLLGLMTRLLSRFGSLLPVVRTAIAYPMSVKFRTGLTLAMFALVVFTLVFMSVFVHVMNETFGVENIEVLTGGYDVQADVSDLNPIPDLEASIAAAPELDAADFDTVAGYGTRRIDANQESGQRGWGDYLLNVVDDDYLSHTNAEFILLADGYDTPEAVWRAMREDPNLALVDSFAVPSRNAFGMVVGGPQFRVEGVYQEDERMAPIPVRVREPGGAEFEVQIIGVIDTGFIFNPGLFISRDTWMAATGEPIPSTTFLIELADGVDAVETARALESVFLSHGMEAQSFMAEIEQQRGLNDSMMGLIQAFMGLGLVVGVAALGVVSTRAVVERRHQIGVLRAIGYRPWMIQWSFLLESSFVALLGIFIGLALGLILAYNFYNGEVANMTPGLEIPFAIPWARLGIIVAIAYGASLLMTYLPAWQAARVYPAEALRYE